MTSNLFSMSMCPDAKFANSIKQLVELIDGPWTPEIETDLFAPKAGVFGGIELIKLIRDAFSVSACLSVLTMVSSNPIVYLF